MAQTLLKLSANFQTQLAAASAVGATSLTFASVTDADGIALPSGTYGFTVDEGTSTEEHFTGVLTTTNTTIASINHVTRTTAAATSGLNTAHRLGAIVKITDHPVIRRIANVLDATTGFDSATPLKYDGNPTFANNAEIITKKYADDLAIAGSPDATTSTKGIGRVSVAPASAAIPIFVGDNDGRVPTQGENDALVGNNTDIAVGSGNKMVTQTGLQHNAEKYAADAGANDTYVITLSPVPTSYTNGMVVYFKANTANTGAATINVNSLGAKTIVKYVSTTLDDGDIAAGMFCTLIYDGTNFVLQNPSAVVPASSADLDSTVSTLLTNNYYTFSAPLLGLSASTIAGWTCTGMTTALTTGGGYNTLTSNGGTSAVYSFLPGTGSQTTYRFSDGKTIRIKFRVKLTQTTNIKGFGIANNTDNWYLTQADTARDAVRFVENAGTLYAVNCNSSAATATDVSSGITRTNWNVYEIIFVPTVSAKFYINGTLVATHTTNLPTGTGGQNLGFGISANGESMLVQPTIVSIQN